MKRPLVFCLVFCLAISFSLSAQNTIIEADTTKGCESLTVNLSYTTKANLVSPLSTQWKIGSITILDKDRPSVNINNKGAFRISLKLTDANFVTDSAQSIFVYVGKKPSLNLSSQEISGYGNHAYRISGILNDTEGAPFKYENQWFLPGGEKPDSLSIIYEFGKTGTFPVSLIVKDIAGCADTSFVTISVKDSLLVPNVFSPNDDGINDLFTINSDGESIITLKIYTRTGILIYYSEAKYMQWDGRMLSGQPALPGMYYYVVESKGRTNTSKSGYVYLFR